MKVIQFKIQVTRGENDFGSSFIPDQPYREYECYFWIKNWIGKEIDENLMKAMEKITKALKEEGWIK